MRGVGLLLAFASLAPDLRPLPERAERGRPVFVGGPEDPALPAPGPTARRIEDPAAVAALNAAHARRERVKARRRAETAAGGWRASGAAGEPAPPAPG